MSTVPKWFPRRQGLISGVLLMGFGAGGMIIGSAFTALTPQKTGAWRVSLPVMGILMAVVLAVCALFLRAPSADLAVKTAESIGTVELTPGQMLCRRGFWCFFLWATLFSAAGLAIFPCCFGTADRITPAVLPL